MTTLLEQPKTEPMPSPASGPSRMRRALSDDGVPALLVEHVTKRFVVGRKKKPVMAINDVSIRIRRGEIYGVLGANGSGKSTLIRLVSTLLTLDTGRVEVFGDDIERDEMKVKRVINRVSVDAAFFKKLSPMENLLFAARLYGIDSKFARSETVRITERLGIAEKRLGPLEQMSRGCSRRSRSRGAADQPDPAAPGRADHRPRPAVEAGRADLHRGAAGHARRNDRADDARPGRGGPALRPDRDHQ